LDRQDQGRSSVGQTGQEEEQRWTDRTRGGAAVDRQDKRRSSGGQTGQGEYQRWTQDKGRIIVKQKVPEEDHRWTERNMGGSALYRQYQGRISVGHRTRGGSTLDRQAQGRISLGQATGNRTRNEGKRTGKT
jgi:hypothetical protein